MKRRFLLGALVGLGSVLGLVSGSLAATSSVAGVWGNAIEVPSTATLNSGGEANVVSVSCAGAGACTAGGYYRDGSSNLQAFVVSETNGSWGNAVEVPGTPTLNGGGYARVNSVACAAAGDCTGGGTYRDGSNHLQAFVVSETNGSWGNAVEVPGTPTLNSGGNAQVNSVSCAKANACTAGGTYRDGSNHLQAFVVSETNGSWGNAVEVPGTATLNSGGNARVNSVACAKANACTAGGTYRDGSSNLQAFVVSETNGNWSDAVEVPGTPTLNGGGDAQVNSVACAKAGSCTAGGTYRDGSNHLQAFVVSETNGNWSDAVEVPGTATLNGGGDAQVNSVACAKAGSCTAGGYYGDGSSNLQAFVVSETNGNWGNAVEVPGTPTLNGGGYAQVNSVSCAAAGDCTGGGTYRDGSSNPQAFVVSETNGNWGNAVEVPGTPTLNSGGDAQMNSVSCAKAGSCTAGGSYYDGSTHLQAFVVTFAWPCVVPKVVGKTLSAAKKTLPAAYCGLGKITKVYSKLKKGHVVAQNLKPGKHLKNGAKVALTLSEGTKT